MNAIQVIGIILFWFVVGVFGFRSVNHALFSVRYRSRLSEGDSLERVGHDGHVRKSRFRLWLFGAGFESPSIVTYFVLIEIGFIFLGISLAVLLVKSGWLPWVADGLLTIPGNIGQLFIPIFHITPYLLALIMMVFPFSYIAGRRRRREERTEEELPIFLEYLVTLSEAGLGFDEALGKVLDIKKGKSELGDVFRKFRKEVLAGTSRLAAYWRIRERLQTHSVRTFSSALIQAENSGGSIAGILRQQGADALDRRRMKALEFTHTLPVRLLFPMMCCFLPGLMTVLLGPLLFRMIVAVESITRAIGG